MKTSEKEKLVIEWYDRNAEVWANQRKKLSEPSFWAQEYNEFKQLKVPQGKLLEIGSGSGREAMEWIQMGYEYFGIDTSKNLIEVAKQTEPAGHYFHASIYEMPFEPHTFDAFSSWAMLPHVPKERIRHALLEIHRVLKRDGIGFIAMREGTGERQEEKTGRWFSYYLQDEFVEILEDCGFTAIRKGRKISRPDLTWLTFFVQAKTKEQ